MKISGYFISKPAVDQFIATKDFQTPPTVCFVCCYFTMSTLTYFLRHPWLNTVQNLAFYDCKILNSYGHFILLTKKTAEQYALFPASSNYEYSTSSDQNSIAIT